MLTRRGLLTRLAGTALAPLCPRQTVAGTPAPNASADEVVVVKSMRRMVLLRHGAPLRRYRIALGPDPRSPKRHQGDGRTPEGRYIIDWRNPGSAYHLSLHISYPNAEDRAAAAALGRDPGGMIMIHGLPNGLGFIGSKHHRLDWTNGCIAVTNDEIREIWALVADGTPITLYP